MFISDIVQLRLVIAVSICLKVGSSFPESTIQDNQVALLRVGVPIEDTLLKPDPPEDGFTFHKVKAIYDWPDRGFCGYNFRVQAVTNGEVNAGVTTSRHFLIITLDQRPFDILELSDPNSFFSDDVKFGRFILTQTVWSCDKLRMDYRLKGDECRARVYRRVITLASGREAKEGHRFIVKTDYRWEAWNDNCDPPPVNLL